MVMVFSSRFDTGKLENGQVVLGDGRSHRINDSLERRVLPSSVGVHGAFHGVVKLVLRFPESLAQTLESEVGCDGSRCQ